MKDMSLNMKQPFLVGGRSKKFEDWVGSKNVRTGGGRVLLLGGLYPIKCHAHEWK